MIDFQLRIVNPSMSSRRGRFAANQANTNAQCTRPPTVIIVSIGSDSFVLRQGRLKGPEHGCRRESGGSTELIDHSITQKRCNIRTERDGKISQTRHQTSGGYKTRQNSKDACRTLAWSDPCDSEALTTRNSLAPSDLMEATYQVPTMKSNLSADSNSRCTFLHAWAAETLSRKCETVTCCIGLKHHDCHFRDVWSPDRSLSRK